MLIKEYRIILPMSVEEYQIAQLYSVDQASKRETGGGEGVEIVTNEKYDGVNLLEGQPTSGQFTHKVYHMKSKVPAWLRFIAPKGSLEFHEKAWNAYPYCRTKYSNPQYMKDKFWLTIESLHLADRGTSENVHNLPPEKLAKREVVYIDIANDYVDPKEYKAEWDPSKFRCEKAQRGPLTGNWKDTADPVMCCYKLVTIEFKWFGIQSKVESWSHKAERKLFLNFHRQVFCWMDEWYGLTMDDIREIEEKTKEMLDEQRRKGELRSLYVPADE
ncbi:phosphatidylinositol transfer protein alpha isoform-like [Paramacrobiotus metropolitanus]|uniref:phosphatidylinositol transfer protein alpha isoform-like n=1 Tax=Paramacrobiotus metropolitanus TaxID=2943436 RepID=UPI0024458A18|nr:phosphatidylinositol transfer protein alpha isoform-like [Paramacrobiotus metropolitanus]